MGGKVRKLTEHIYDHSPALHSCAEANWISSTAMRYPVDMMVNCSTESWVVMLLWAGISSLASLHTPAEPNVSPSERGTVLMTKSSSYVNQGKKARCMCHDELMKAVL